MVTKMADEEIIFIKNGDEKTRTEKPGKTYRLMVKSQNMESIIAELDPHTESKWFKHNGEEMHLVLSGEMEYTVGEKTYKLSEGDMLWHKSNLKHHAKNIGSEKVVYVTVGTPPTFSMNIL
jgi:quercetin dioxygenase-like cupin family protein